MLPLKRIFFAIKLLLADSDLQTHFIFSSIWWYQDIWVNSIFVLEYDGSGRAMENKKCTEDRDNQSEAEVMIKLNMDEALTSNTTFLCSPQLKLFCLSVCKSVSQNI